MKNFKYLLSVFSVALILTPGIASAHCPLCTAAAGVLAIAAATLGVSVTVVGLFIGAFSMALGIWIAGSIKKKYVKYQDLLITIIIFLGTVIPIMPLIKEYRPLYVSLFGSYGTIFHNTYTVNMYLLGVGIGAVLLVASPFLSKYFSKLTGKKVPFQKMIVIFGLLIVLGLVLQFTLS